MENKKGTIFIALSALFYATYGIWSRLMGGTFGEFNQAYIRAILLLAVLIPFGILTKGFRKVKREDVGWFVVIACMGGFNQAPFYFGFQHLPVGTATLLFYCMLTVGAYIIGTVFFKENLTKTKYVALVLAVVGLFVIYKFSLTSQQVIPALATSIAGLMGACFVVMSKKLSGNYSETQILTALAVVMFFGNVILSIGYREVFPTVQLSTPWAAEIFYSFALLIANAFVIEGFKHIEPSVGGVIGLLEVILAAVFGIVLFKEVLTIQLIVGSALLLISAGLTDAVNIAKKKINL